MANGCSIQQSVFNFAGGDRSVICPKPRRIFSPAIALEPKSANHILDALFSKPSDPAPLFFSGSPLARSDNPMVHDARFGESTPIPIATEGSGCGSESGSVRSVDARIRYGLTPAAVRIEGFDCLDHERSCRSRGIPAFA
ncbi:uncharacterized protein LOC110030202 [Phalaenopsis equestris]|uniref:uncharacterized protein LOC110030202 n=1 Tax=Phalaenopsis equestris TaxID=78828 RepID=UPI0009E19447|nr:uncharacterized protein LOC110030202 [Phalaenopsis equestris]